MPPMDKLSCLPDDVICHILSFLPTKCSAQTSVLSKRWRFIWAHVPSLVFEVGDKVYSEIITKIVLQHKHDIHTFLLHIFDGSKEEFESLIANIIKRNIRNLVLCLGNWLVLPQCLFPCKTLVDLSLTACGGVIIPKSGIYFPALKKLKLRGVVDRSHESLSRLISGCPVLEELKIVGIMINHFYVSSPTLTRLELRLYSDDLSDYQLKLDTPTLRYLWFNCSLVCDISIGTLDSLTTVVVCGFRCSKEHDFDVVRHILRSAKVLKRMEILITLRKCDWEKDCKAIKKLECFERASQECQVVINYY